MQSDLTSLSIAAFPLSDNVGGHQGPRHRNLGLHTAAASGDVEAALFAMQTGQPSNSVLNGILPLHAACSSGNEEMVLLLLDHGADINAGRLPAPLGEAPGMGTIGSTALHFAAANGHTAVVRILLRRGACATARDRDGMTPELLAVANDHWSTASYIRAWVQKHHTDAHRSSLDSLDGSSPPTNMRLRSRRSFDQLSAAAAGVKSTIRITKKSALSRISSSPSLKSADTTQSTRPNLKPITIPKIIPYRNNGLLSPTLGGPRQVHQSSRVRKSSLPNFSHKRSNTCASVLSLSQATVQSDSTGSGNKSEIPSSSRSLNFSQASLPMAYVNRSSDQTVPTARTRSDKREQCFEVDASFLLMSDDDADKDDVSEFTATLATVGLASDVGPYAHTMNGDTREHLREQSHVRPMLPRSQSNHSDSSRTRYLQPVAADSHRQNFLAIPCKASSARDELASAPSSNNFNLFSSTQCSLQSLTVSLRSRNTSTPSSNSSQSLKPNSTLPKSSQERALAILRTDEDRGALLDSDGTPVTLAHLLAAYGEALQRENCAMIATANTSALVRRTKTKPSPLPLQQAHEGKPRSQSLTAFTVPVRPRSASIPLADRKLSSSVAGCLSSSKGLRTTTLRSSDYFTSANELCESDHSFYNRFMIASESTFNELRPGDWYGDISSLPGIPKNCSVSSLGQTCTSGVVEGPINSTSTPRSQSHIFNHSSSPKQPAPRSPLSTKTNVYQEPTSPSPSRWKSWNVKKQRSVATIKIGREAMCHFGVSEDLSGYVTDYQKTDGYNIHSSGKAMLKNFIVGLKNGVAR